MKILDRLDALAERATPGPWAWTFAGEKCMNWETCIGTIVGSDDEDLAGYQDGLPDDAVVVDYLFSGESGGRGSGDTEFVVALVNAYPALARVARAAEITEGALIMYLAGKSSKARLRVRQRELAAALDALREAGS